MFLSRNMHIKPALDGEIFASHSQTEVPKTNVATCGFKLGNSLSKKKETQCLSLMPRQRITVPFFNGTSPCDTLKKNHR